MQLREKAGVQLPRETVRTNKTLVKYPRMHYILRNILTHRSETMACGDKDCECSTPEKPVGILGTHAPDMVRAMFVPKDKKIGDILLDAHETINGPRNDTYGNPIESHQRIATMWSAYLGTPVTAKDAAMMLLLLKVSRAKTDPDIDSIRDIAGYAGIAADLHIAEHQVMGTGND